jgi:hypothetical protein
MDFLTFKHSFNSGDLISVLPGIKHLCEKNNTKAIVYQRLNLQADYGHNDPHPVKDNNGRHVCMNEDIFNMMKPLLEAQPYIEKFEIWEGQQAMIDYDKTRHNSQMPLPGGSIHKWPSLIYPQLECDLNEPWISIPANVNYQLAWEVEMAHLAPSLSPEEIIRIYDQTGRLFFKRHESRVVRANICNDKVLINRTERYQNPYIDYSFLKMHEDVTVFAGTRQEYDIFCKKWNLTYAAYLSVDNFLDLSIAIKKCKLFIGNQSFCWHLADAMKVPRILEVCAQYPNTFPTGSNGYSFITQEALEFRFHKLLNESNG